VINIQEPQKGNIIAKTSSAYVEFGSIEVKESAMELTNLFKGKYLKIEDKQKETLDFNKKGTLCLTIVKINKSLNFVHDRGGNTFGPMKGRFVSERNFKPY
jgi:hypothetical protein